MDGRERWVRITVAGLLLSALGWVDPLYLPLILLGPLVTGVVLGRKGLAREWAVGTWVVAGLGALISDALINQEDVAFHAVVTVVTSLLAWGAWAAARPRRRAAV